MRHQDGRGVAWKFPAIARHTSAAASRGMSGNDFAATLEKRISI
jgi:hypothetical protein